MFTRDEVEALRVYSGEGYRRINDYLRGDGDCAAAVTSHIRHLDAAIARSRLPTGMILFRGVNGEAAARMRASRLAIGDRFRESGFASSSADPDRSRLFAAWPPGGFILRIRVRTGMCALDMTPFSENPDEREYLLPRDLRMAVTGLGDGAPRTIDVDALDD